MDSRLSKTVMKAELILEVNSSSKSCAMFERQVRGLYALQR